jgi:DamX protein
LRLLERLVQGGDSLILVIGEFGIGKTTLLERYLGASESSWETCRLRLNSGEAENQISQQELDDQPAYLLQDADDPILMIDDAHRLTQQQLEYLLKNEPIAGNSNKIKRLVLFGEQGLIDAAAGLTTLLDEKSAVSKIHLSALSKEETAGYLNHRLAMAGYKGKPVFRSSLIKKIYRNSRGIPGEINMAADQILEEKYSTERPEQNDSRGFSDFRWQTAGWAVSGCAVCIIALVSVFYALNKPIPEKAPAAALSPKVIRKKIIFAQKFETSQQPIPGTEQPEQEVSAPQPLLTKAEKPEAKIAQQDASTPGQPGVSPAKSAPVVMAQTEMEPDIVKKGVPTQTPPRVSSGKSKGMSAPKSQTVVENDGVKKKKIHRESWLLSQDKSFFTIQVMAVHDEKYLQAFIDKYRLSERGEIAYCRTLYRGKDWYPLLYGVYATKQDAYSAIKRLPLGVQQTSPWIRKLSAVQHSIQKRSQQ